MYPETTDNIGDGEEEVQDKGNVLPAKKKS
jgi:hypothetical protein